MVWSGRNANITKKSILETKLAACHRMCCVAHESIRAGWRLGRRRRQSELTDFSGRIRGQKLWAPTAARIRGHELSGRIRGHGLSAPAVPNPSPRTFRPQSEVTDFWRQRCRSELANGIFWRSAGGAHPSRKDFPSAGKTKWVTNPISKSDHMASDMCI